VGCHAPSLLYTEFKCTFWLLLHMHGPPPHDLTFPHSLARSLTPLQVILLVDEELGALPWEALPLMRQHCSCVSRATSLYHLRAGMQAVATGPGNGSFDMASVTYVVDSRCEGSLPEHTQVSNGVR
jgi:hypothetical protein